VRPGDGQDAGVRPADGLLPDSQTPSNNHLAVFAQRLADRAERFLDRGVDEAAGVDDYEVSALVAGGSGITFRTQLGEDALGVDERLGTA
jgi:hypothetical protein